MAERLPFYYLERNVTEELRLSGQGRRAAAEQNDNGWNDNKTIRDTFFTITLLPMFRFISLFQMIIWFIDLIISIIAIRLFDCLYIDYAQVGASYPGGYTRLMDYPPPFTKLYGVGPVDNKPSTD